MVAGGRRKSIALFIALGAGVIIFCLFLYVGWVLLNWRNGIVLFFGVVLLMIIISGVVLNTTFLVREIRRNEQHDAFINAVTHELKTPVASIRLYLETLMTRTVDENRRAEFYRVMLDDSDRLLKTIEQVLRTGRVGPATRLQNAAPVDIHSIVEECREKALTLHSLPEESLIYQRGAEARVLGDADELRAAVSNLIDNAIKYSSGQVHVLADTTHSDGRHLFLRIRDNGMGIPKGELKRIFRRFYRVPGPASQRKKGTGLGLYIVRSVAKRHKGRAWAESEGPGKGSTFVLKLPLLL